jgi:hypothetical protein
MMSGTPAWLAKALSGNRPVELALSILQHQVETSLPAIIGRRLCNSRLLDTTVSAGADAPLEFDASNR